MRLIVKLFLCNVLISLSADAQDKMSHIGLYDNKVSFARDTHRISEFIIGINKLRHTHTDSAIGLYRRTLAESRQLGYSDGVARSLTGLGLFYMDKGDFTRSLSYYEMAKPFCLASNYKNGILIVALYNNIAALYGNRGISDSAAGYYYRSLTELRRRNIKDTTMLVLIYANLGGRLIMENQMDQARFYLDKGKELAIQTDNKRMLLKIFVDLSAMYGSLNKQEQNRFYAFRALNLLKDIKDPASEVDAYCNIGNSYLSEKRPLTALRYYQKAFDKDIGASNTQLVVAYRGLGAACYELKNYKRAEQYYLKAIQISTAGKLNKSLMDCYKALVTIYADQGYFKRAFQYRNLFAAVRDCTVNAERSFALGQLELKYRTAEKDRELAQQQLLLTQQQSRISRQNIWIGSIAGASLLLIGLLSSIYKSRKAKQDLQLSRLENEKEVTHLKAMIKGEENERIRIARELHDGIMVRFSAAQMNLSTLIENSDVTEMKEFEKILVQLEEATRELRKSAHNLMPDILLEEGLAGATHYFCKTLARTANMQIDFHLIGEEPVLAADYELMIYRMIQELLNNTVKHARATYVLVQISSQPHLISFVVEDNGVGFTPRAQEGIGLKNIQSRIQSLFGHVAISSRPGAGTSVYIELETKYLGQQKTEKDANYSSYNR
jgi:two-component system NarL family sensor kinase